MSLLPSSFQLAFYNVMIFLVLRPEVAHRTSLISQNGAQRLLQHTHVIFTSVEYARRTDGHIFRACAFYYFGCAATRPATVASTKASFVCCIVHMYVRQININVDIQNIFLFAFRILIKRWENICLIFHRIVNWTIFLTANMKDCIKSMSPRSGERKLKLIRFPMEPQELHSIFSLRARLSFFAFMRPAPS